MKILVVGSGGREHAIIKKLKENKSVDTIYALPGNGGIAADAVCVPIGACEIEKIADFAKKNAVDFAVVAPDDPLVLGCVDALEDVGIPCFGPRANAAIIEGSKVFAKNLMKKYSIPTAAYEVFDDPDKAISYIESVSMPVVVKADGLALGKGVTVAMTKEEAVGAVNDAMKNNKFGAGGRRVVIEEYLEGPEVSVLSFTDGKTVVPMVSSMDHKRAYDNDIGPNTGGMGTIAPNPYYTPEIAAVCMKEIFIPTINAMNSEGRTFKGCLYFGLMLTKSGPKVIEYNCRFGDPETQVVLPLLETDLLTVMTATAQGRLSDTEIRFGDRAACCVIMASDGYPLSYKKGFEVSVPNDLADSVYYAGVTLENGRPITSGGRVLGVVGIADRLPDAIKDAYDKVGRIHFENAFYRRDIGRKAMKKTEV